MSISKRLRFEILQRDHFRCFYCGAAPPRATLHLDHVIPKSRGGLDWESNLVTACEDCNMGKGAAGLGFWETYAINYTLAIVAAARLGWRIDTGKALPIGMVETIQREVDAYGIGTHGVISSALIELAKAGIHDDNEATRRLGAEICAGRDFWFDLENRRDAEALLG